MGEASDSTKLPLRKAPNPCNACRLRHLKCDDRRPACSNCRKGSSECVRGYNVRFRHKLNPSVNLRRGAEPKRAYSFSHDQAWVKTRRRLSFVDETEDTINLHNAETGTFGTPGSVSGAAAPHEFRGEMSSPESLAGLDAASSASSVSWTSQTISGSTRKDQSNQPRNKRRTQSLNQPYTQPIDNSGLETSVISQTSTALANVPCVSNNTFIPLAGEGSTENFLTIQLFGEAGTPPNADSAVSDSPLGTPGSTIYSDTPQWPLPDYQQAVLLRYFIDNLSQRFDLCDQSVRHFATVVPQRAVTCPLLLNAILAATAKHLSMLSDFDELVVAQYHQNCISLLLPTLSSSQAVDDEILLASIVILRFMEEMDVPISAPRPQSHFLGTRIFLGAQKNTRDFSGLRLAAYWVALRQEIYMACLSSRPVHENFTIVDIGSLVGPDDTGSVYANRIVVHSANCLQFCYGSEEHSVAEWKKLRDFQVKWWRDRPWYYQPLWRDDSESNFFPSAILLNDAVVTGLQHYYLSRMLLTAHNPTVPRLGPGQVLAFRKMNEEIKEIVRHICGIAESNPRTAPAYVNAWVAITMAGERFTERSEQEALYAILLKSDKDMAWSTRSSQKTLRELWGWEENLPHSDMSIAGLLNTGSQKSPRRSA